jgi:hypothetical protein
MRIFSASVAAAGVAIMLSGCAYHDDPDYGPYPPAYDRGAPEAPPPGYQGDNGPPGDYDAPPQAGYGPQDNGPQGGYDGAPPDNYGPPPGRGPDQGQSYGPQGGPDQDDVSGGPSDKADRAMSKINNPNWCAKHRKKCDKLRARYGEPDRQMDPSNDQPPPEQ